MLERICDCIYCKNQLDRLDTEATRVVGGVIGFSASLQYVRIVKEGSTLAISRPTSQVRLCNFKHAPWANPINYVVAIRDADGVIVSTEIHEGYDITLSWTNFVLVADEDGRMHQVHSSFVSNRGKKSPVGMIPCIYDPSPDGKSPVLMENWPHGSMISVNSDLHTVFVRPEDEDSEIVRGILSVFLYDFEEILEGRETYYIHAPKRSDGTLEKPEIRVGYVLHMGQSEAVVVNEQGFINVVPRQYVEGFAISEKQNG